MTAVVVMISCVIPAEVVAQTPLTGKNATAAVKEITSGYTPWNTAGWSGKLQGDMLPVSVTMKVYMRRDSLTLISMRAPLVGEVARIEIDNSAILVVNKMKKQYVKIDLTDYGKHPALIHSSLQDILIGRVSVIGAGTLSDKNVKNTDLYNLPGQGYLISCEMPEEYGAFNYGYGVDTSDRIVSMMAIKGKTSDSSAPSGMDSETTSISFQFAADIAYNKNSATAELAATFRGKDYLFTLKNISLEFGPSGFNRITLSNSYTKCDIREVLRF